MVEDVSLSVARGEIVGLAGESGSGKTLTCRSLSGLLSPGVATGAGTLEFEGREYGRSREGWPQLRGRVVTIFQDPRQAMNNVRTIEAQFGLVLALVEGGGKAERKKLVRDYMQRVEIREADRVARSFPWELSGGMLQRVVVAMVLARRPALIVADEPTSNLDAAVRNKLIRLILDTATELDAGLLLVTHDLPLLMRVCDRVHVMRRGAIVESGTPEGLLRTQAHPYTRLLLDQLELRGYETNGSMSPAPSSQHGN